MSQRKSLTQTHIKAVFLSDIRGKFKKCQICSKEFGFTRAEHQCKRCRRAVCEKCSNSKLVYITETGPSKRPHRVCDICKDESQWIRRFIEQQKISIGVDDTLAYEWLKASGLTVEMAKEEYAKAQQNMNKDKEEYLRMRQELQAAMIELWLNLNYSLREFLNYMIKESDYENFSNRISKVLGALLIQYPDIGYCSDQILITMLLLCFASEASAYTLLVILYSEVIPFNTYPTQLRKYQYDYTSEVDKTLQVIEQAFRLKQSEISLIKPFIRNKIARYLQTLGINFFQLQTSFFIINQTLLNPKNGYDNLLKCLASAFSIRYEEIKQFPSSFDEIESQLLKGVHSVDLEKNYLQTKLILFLQHNHGVTQSVIISRPLEVKQQQVVHQIKIEHIQDQKTQRKIEQEDDMLQYTVLQDNDFQLLRRKTVQIQAQPQVDEEKANLKDYIEKVEETLMLKHKLVIQLQNRIKELQNQPPQIVNKDADQQLLQANEQLRMRIAAQDQEIYLLQEQKKYSDRLQEDSQLIINNLKKSNFELNEQLNSQIQSNKELQTTVILLRTQVEQSTDSQQIEKNYQINISVQSKHTEDKLLLQLEEERQKIFNLEISNNQMNKEYIALQQLNQDKLRIIGNLEFRLIQAEAAKRDREIYYIELVELKKKLEGHELAIIQQQEQYTILLEGFNKQNIEIDLLKREKLTLTENLQKRESELQLIISSLRSQLQELQAQLDSITIQLNQSLQINQKLQNLIVEKDQNIEQLNIKIKIEIKRYEELTIQLSSTIEEHKRILSEKELLILNLRQNDSQLRDQQQQLRNEFEIKSQLFLKLQVEFDAYRQNSQNFESKYLIVFKELDSLKNQWNVLNQTHINLVETHRITILELDNLRGQHSSLLSQHTQLSEKHKLIIIELDDFKSKWTTLQREHHALTEKHRLIIIELQTVNERCVILTNQQNESSSKHNLIVIESNQFKDRFNSLTQQYNQLNEKHNIVVLELNSMKEQYNILSREHNQLNEQHRLILTQFQTLDEKHKIVIFEFNSMKQNYDVLTREQEQYKQIQIQFQALDEKHKIVVLELNTMKQNYEILTREQHQLKEQHRLNLIQLQTSDEKHKAIVLELNTMKQNYDILTREHHSLNEQHRLGLIQLQTLDEKHRLLIIEHNNLQEQHRLIVIQYNQAQQYQIDLNEKIRIIDELRLLLQQSEDKYNLLFTQNKQLQDKYQLDIQIHLKRVSELELLIVELEKKLLEMTNNYNSLRIQIEQYMSRISILEQEKIEFQKNYNELTILSQNYKVTIISLEERITVLVAEVQQKETYINELLITIERQNVSIIDYEELIRRLKAQIVDQEKQIARLKLTLKQFKELSTELAQID